MIRVRDVTFNEDEVFSGDKELFKDDLLSITNEEMEALLKQCELPPPLPGTIGNLVPLQEEDVEEDYPVFNNDSIVAGETDPTAPLSAPEQTIAPDGHPSARL